MIIVIVLVIGSMDVGTTDLEKNPNDTGIRKSITTISITNQDSFN